MQFEPDPMYAPNNIPLYEILYGKNLISLGSFDAIDNMFSDIDLNRMKLLDIGFGLGGVAFYLAKKYQIEIAGIEIHQWMVDYTESQKDSDISHLLKFTTYNNAGKMPFDSASFDLVYSKGVLNHVADKKSLFLEINRILKPGALFVIADWIYPEIINNDDSSPLVKETQETYREILEYTGFTNISFRNDSQIFLIYVEKFLENLILKREIIEKNFGTKMFLILMDDHQNLINLIKDNKKTAVRIKATRISM